MKKINKSYASLSTKKWRLKIDKEWLNAALILWNKYIRFSYGFLQMLLEYISFLCSLLSSFSQLNEQLKKEKTFKRCFAMMKEKGGRKIINSPVSYKLLNILLNSFLIAFFFCAFSLLVLACLHERGSNRRFTKFQM